MAYYDYPIGWIAGGAKANGKSHKRYALDICEVAERDNNHGQKSQAAAEFFWYEDGKPYYKVDDAAVELFRKVSIDIPFKYVVAPFKQFLLRFTDTNPLKTKFGPVRSVLVMSITSEQAVEETPALKDNSVVKNGFFALFVDVGEKVNGMPWMNYAIMHRCPEIPVSESFKNLPIKGESDIIDSGIERDLLSIAISVCFLATSSDKIIKPDVLSKDFAAYLEAERKNDTERIRVMAERAKRKGKIGYLVDGKREMIHHAHDKYEGEPTGRELRFKHVRSAHFRRYESGAVLLIRQCVVRPDLPAPNMK